MKRIEENRLLGHSPEQLFDMVKDIESYPEFLPWCNAARLRSYDNVDGIEIIEADLVIGFKAFRERFGSSVRVDRNELKINVDYLDGPFKTLKNEWQFSGNGSGCDVYFFVEFEFSSKILEAAIGAVFDHAMRQIVNAFEKRAVQLYGKPL